LAFALLILLPGPGGQAVAQAAKAAYPAMAPLDQYLISDEQSEIALARSAAPSSISDGAEVMVLGREGYKTAVKGTNGFLCIVERSWAQGTDDAEFWNPKMRAPHCFNAQAARSFAPIYRTHMNLRIVGMTIGALGPQIDLVVLAERVYCRHQPDPEIASVIFEFSTTEGIDLDELQLSLVCECNLSRPNVQTTAVPDRERKFRQYSSHGRKEQSRREQHCSRDQRHDS